MKDIYAHPHAWNKQYEGNSYQRWADFCAIAPFEELRKLDIPIYMIVGINDKNSPIYGLDYVKLDFLRLGKTNLTYKTCVGCNHFLVSKEGNKIIQHKYFDKILAWIDRN